MEEDAAGEWSLSSQGRVLCQQYIIQRSIKAGAQIKKIRMLLESFSGGCVVSDDLSWQLLEIIHIMEDLNPSIYDSCSSKLKVTMSTDEQVRWTYENITTQLLKTGVNWGKLISIFTVCGALAADCVSQGHTDYLPVILDCFEESCSQLELYQYLKRIGGWKGVVEHFDRKLRGETDLELKTVSLATTSIHLFQSLSKHVDVPSLAMCCFVFLIIIITIIKLFIRVANLLSWS